MSDCSDDFMVEDESDDFGSDDSGSESNKLENSYYNAKAKLPDPQALTVPSTCLPRQLTQPRNYDSWLPRPSRCFHSRHFLPVN